ncbi:MAG: TrkH family potassium uptake protein [Selenomonadaceae bacterium]|nr:TrkH family potassium uptake protein [Selenomonadaceae bacterium]
MDKKIISSLIGSVLIAFAFIFIAPILYAALVMKSLYAVAIFLLPAIFTLNFGISLARFGKNHRRRLPIIESAISMLIIYPIVALIGMMPFWWTGWLLPFDAFLETISNLTSAGLSLIPVNAPYLLTLWQSLLMWFGSLLFLVILVTIMPTVGGCFGLTMTLQGGQLFSPLFGQMNAISQRMIKVYSLLTLASFFLFKLAGLDVENSVLMALRCISTGGGKFFPSSSNIYVEYAAIFSMLLACGNFLLYYRLIQTLPPPRTGEKEKFFVRAINYVKRFRQNFIDNVKKFASNSEVKTLAVIILFCTSTIFWLAEFRDSELDLHENFRHALFHVVSYISTTGINLNYGDELQSDFDKFLIFFTAIIGGCMGSVTGGLKIVRVLVLLKTSAVELKKTIHPHMMPSIRVNGSAVPPEIVGRILGFFFLSCLTLFVSSALLSCTDPSFSESVAMSAVCLTNVGIFPQIVEPHDFLALSNVAKIFCAIICVIGRLEIFALLIIFASATKKSPTFKEKS